MGNAIWLFLALPKWYFGSLLPPFGDPILTAIPASGGFALIVGALLSLFGERNLNLLWIVASVLVSQLYVAIAGFLRGQMPADSVSWPFWCFISVQLAIIALLVWRSHGNRIAASVLGWFGITYAFFAAFVSEMALYDVWL